MATKTTTATKTETKSGTKNGTKKETKTTTTSSTSKTRRSSNSAIWGRFMNILAFAAVIIGGVGLFLAKLFGWLDLSPSWVSSMQTIANAIGWFALCLLSVKYIRNRRKPWIWVVWTVAVVMIFIGIILK